MKRTIILQFILFTIFACGQSSTKISENVISKFEEFKKKEKFVEGNPESYPGIANEKLRPILTKKINQVADDFESISRNKNIENEDYQIAIKKGLNRFSEIYLDLDTEDRERICLYFEEIMDIVDLKGSNGQLNNFMYGFDPNKIKKQ